MKGKPNTPAPPANVYEDTLRARLPEWRRAVHEGAKEMRMPNHKNNDVFPLPGCDPWAQPVCATVPMVTTETWDERALVLAARKLDLHQLAMQKIEQLRSVDSKPPDLPAEPELDQLQKLAGALNLRINGYTTWEGVVGFAVDEIDRLRTDLRRWLDRSAKWEAEAQRERHRANHAADRASRAVDDLARARREFADQLADLHMELRQLRKKGER